MKNTTKKVARFVATLSLAAAAPAFAQISVKDAWIRATVPQQTATGAFMQITSTKDARLVSAASPAAETVEIHEMRMDGNVMRMGPVSGGIALPAGKTIALKSGGYHVMLMGLKAQAREGESLPLTLVVEGADRRQEKVELKVPVRALTSGH